MSVTGMDSFVTSSSALVKKVSVDFNEKGRSLPKQGEMSFPRTDRGHATLATLRRAPYADQDRSRNLDEE